jgi:pyruvate dehydrogenase E2 component (dihydrolipoamide acetyltransferase)
MSEFRMPSLGADMEAGTLVEWLVNPGAQLKRGDIIAVVETQKGAIEIEVYEDGVLDRVLVEIGTEVPVGTPLALIRGADDKSEACQAAAVLAPDTAAAVLAAAPQQPVIAPPPRSALESAATFVRASPAARRLAQSQGISLGALKGSGPQGAVVLADVEALLKAGHGPATTGPGRGLAGMRKAIAAAMARSKREIPHYYLAQPIGLENAQAWLTLTNRTLPPAERLLAGALFVRATALAARKFPEFNGFFTEHGFEPSAAIHVGVAVLIRGGGLVAPAIHHAADLDLATLMARMRDLVGRVRAGRFRSSEIADPTITVSSLGDRGVETLYGVIYPPQVAIVGFGSITQRPWVDAGAVLPRPVVTATLAADHRASDGHRGALFLAEIGRLLQRPEDL